MPSGRLTRRELITLLGGTVAGWPVAAFAQQPDRVRRIGVLMNLPADDPEALRRVTALVQGLQQLGWTDGRNLRVDYRWGVDTDRIRKNAVELVALLPDVVLANAPPSVLALQQTSKALPIVFVAVTDPVGMGVVQTLARPGGSATGFAVGEWGSSGKWLELLKEIAPQVTRVAFLRDLRNPSSNPQFASIQTVAPSFGIELSPIGLSDAEEIERAVGAFAQSPNGALIASRTAETIAHRELIIRLAARHRLPAVYPLRLFITSGGLVCYGPDIVDQYRQAAGYIDRILKGEKPADLPVQNPTKYQIVLNLKTAKALGLDVPPTLLARADEVIE
jgi:putative tryptophan/tyrosine transport system substrate-binding protein